MIFKETMDELIADFVLGYFDGDGYFGINKYGALQSVIVGTVDFLSGMRNAVMRISDIEISPPRLTKNRVHEGGYVPKTHTIFEDKRGRYSTNGATGTLSMSYNKALQFGEFIYRNALFYMERKHEKWVTAKNMHDAKEK